MYNLRYLWPLLIILIRLSVFMFLYITYWFFAHALRKLRRKEKPPSEANGGRSPSWKIVNIWKLTWLPLVRWVRSRLSLVATSVIYCRTLRVFESVQSLTVMWAKLYFSHITVNISPQKLIGSQKWSNSKKLHTDYRTLAIERNVLFIVKSAKTVRRNCNFIPPCH